MRFLCSTSEYRKYNGLNCSIIRQLTDKEVDSEVGPMYKILLSNNIVIDAFGDELDVESNKSKVIDSSGR